MTDDRVARALIQAGALRFNLSEPFVLASRKIAPVYVDVRSLTSHPEGWRQTVDGLCAVVADFGEGLAISGGELSDLFFSVPVAIRLGRPHLTIRKETKGYGTGGRLVGSIAAGQKFVHVADMVTRATSALSWVAAIRQAGGDIENYVTVFDRDQGGKQALATNKVRLSPLVTLDDGFLRFAMSMGGLTPSQVSDIGVYVADPEGWAKGYLRSHPSFLTDRLSVEGGHLIGRDTVEVLTKGYPELISELGGKVRSRLLGLGVDPEVLNDFANRAEPP